MNYISQNSLHCMFLVRESHKKDSWKIWMQQPFLTKGAHWCCSADSLHWCEPAAELAIALPPQDYPFAAFIPGSGVCVYPCDKGPQHMQDTHVTKVRSNRPDSGPQWSCTQFKLVGSSLPFIFPTLYLSSFSYCLTCGFWALASDVETTVSTGIS